jgi:hypothetical protein
VRDKSFCPLRELPTRVPTFAEPTAVQAETKLREHGIRLPTDTSGSGSHSGFTSLPHGRPPIPSDIGLGDVVSSDFGSWYVRPDARIIVE